MINECIRFPRTLIVGTEPYHPSSSRALDAYFHNWDKASLAQVYSNPQVPIKGHCGQLFQITDERLLQRWKGRDVETGILYEYKDLCEKPDSRDVKEISNDQKKIFAIRRNHSSIVHLLRGLLWKKKYWCTSRFKQWVDDFKPECVFICSSNDFFINKISLYVAQRFNIPIVIALSDDYLFNNVSSFSPFYHLYKILYKRLMISIFRRKGTRAIYICDKMREKYETEFGLIGETVYLTSSVKRNAFRIINTHNPLITYFGNIGLGRNHSLNDIGYALGKIDSSYRLEVYSAEKDSTVYSPLKKNRNIYFGGSIPYEEVKKKMSESDIIVIVEGFDWKDVLKTRYSLSTKAADAIANGSSILVYGSKECGLIDYMIKTECSFTCTSKSELVSCLKDMFSNTLRQKEYYERQIEVSQTNHTIEKSTSTTFGVITNAICVFNQL